MDKESAFVSISRLGKEIETKGIRIDRLIEYDDV